MDPAHLAAALEYLDAGSRFSQVMAAGFIEQHAEDERARVLAWLRHVHGTRGECGGLRLNEWQRGCPEIIPGLAASPWWVTPSSPHAGLVTRPVEGVSSGAAQQEGRYAALLHAVTRLEGEAGRIREELLSLRGRRLFQQYAAPSFKVAVHTDTVRGGREGESAETTGTSSGDWSVLYLDLHSVDCAEAQAACPVTLSVLRQLPRPYGHAMFSALAPRTHIDTHTGPTNKKLRIQLPLVVPEGGACRLRCGPHTEVLSEGRCVVFDDSHQHEAWNDDDHAVRLVLIVDLWHPDLSNPEVRFLSFVRNAQLRKARALSAAGHVPAGADFFKLLEEKRHRRVEDDDVFGAHASPGAAAGEAHRLVPLQHAPVRDD